MTYNLPPITLLPQTPAWAVMLITAPSGEQAQADKAYEAAVDAYYSAAQQWIDTQTLNRSIAPDPAAYVPTLFTRRVPERVEWLGWDALANDGAGAWVKDTYVDPNIHPPVLPVWKPLAPPTQPKTGAPADAASSTAFQAATISLLQRIAGKLGA